MHQKSTTTKTKLFGETVLIDVKPKKEERQKIELPEDKLYKEFGINPEEISDETKLKFITKDMYKDILLELINIINEHKPILNVTHNFLPDEGIINITCMPNDKKDYEKFVKLQVFKAINKYLDENNLKDYNKSLVLSFLMNDNNLVIKY